MLLNCGVGEDSWESLGLQGDPTSPSYRRSVLDVHWREWCWSWNSNTLATWWGELTHLKRPWCWERWKVEGEGDDREWDDWMALLTQWTWVWANSGREWRIGKPGMLQSMGLQRVRHDLATGQQQPLWGTVQRFLKKLKIELPYNPEIPLLGIYPNKTLIWKDTGTCTFITALSTIAKPWKEPKCPLMMNE